MTNTDLAEELPEFTTFYGSENRVSDFEKLC